MFLNFFFFFNDTATTEIYTLSLHDALPILPNHSKIGQEKQEGGDKMPIYITTDYDPVPPGLYTARLDMIERSEEHTSELQSRQYLVCRLLLEKKKKIKLAI